MAVWESNDGNSEGIFGRFVQPENCTAVPTTTTSTSTSTTTSTTTSLTPTSVTTPAATSTAAQTSTSVATPATTTEFQTTTSTIPPTSITTEAVTTAASTTPTSNPTNGTEPIIPSSDVAVIAGSVVGATVGVALVVLIAVLAARKCKKKDLAPDDGKNNLSDNSETEMPNKNNSEKPAPTSSDEEAVSEDNKNVEKNTKKAANISIVADNGYKEVCIVDTDEGDKKYKTLPPPADSKNLATDIEWNEIELTKKLGSGAFGTVHLAMWKDTTKVAVKQLKGTYGEEQLKEFKREMNLMANLKHPHLITSYGMGTNDEGNAFVVMEYMRGGSLCDYIEKNELPLEQMVKVAIGISKGLDFLHSKGIVHRDVRSPNILLTKHLEPKIADFGLARLIDKENKADTKMDNQAFGCYGWMDPNLYYERKYTVKSDIYSYGMVLWEMAARKKPFADIEPMYKVEHIFQKKNKEKIPDNCHPKYAALIKWCWSDKPEDRPTPKEAIGQLKEIKEEIKPATTPSHTN